MKRRGWRTLIAGSASADWHRGRPTHRSWRSSGRHRSPARSWPGWHRSSRGRRWPRSARVNEVDLADVGTDRDSVLPQRHLPQVAAWPSEIAHQLDDRVPAHDPVVRANEGDPRRASHDPTHLVGARPSHGLDHGEVRMPEVERPLAAMVTASRPLLPQGAFIPLSASRATMQKGWAAATGFERVRIYDGVVVDFNGTCR